jgi:hypothetical protein
MAKLQRLPSGAPVEDVVAVIEEDGGLILEGLLTPAQVAKLNAELDPLVIPRKPGNTAGVPDTMAEFSGRNTKRITGLVTRSEVLRDDILSHPYLLGYIDALLKPYPDAYWLSTAQVIEIQPGEKAQALHRDLENFPIFRDAGPAAAEATVNCIVALSEFTEETGGTRVIPGSHKWPDFSNRGAPEMTIPVEMRPGSAVLYSGKLVHGGGANRSSTPRRALTLPFALGYLTPEEAYPFYVPLELARTLPPRAQQLLGFRSFHNMTQGAGSVWQLNYEELAHYLKLDA